MRHGTKRPIYDVVASLPDTEYRRYIMERCSKAALWDAFIQTVALVEGHADDAPTEDEVRRHLEPILRMRGDRIP